MSQQIRNLFSHVRRVLDAGRPASKRRRHLQSLRSVAVRDIEVLEERTLLTAFSLTNEEQLLIELVNRARANPSGEATRYGIGLNSFDPSKGESAPNPAITATPKQPLAPHQVLIDIANSHSQDMLNRNFFSHTSPAPTNKDAADRGLDAGYPTLGNPPAALVGENIAVVFRQGAFSAADLISETYERHEALFRSVSHRINMLHDPYEEIGTGIRTGRWTRPSDNITYDAVMVTENFGLRNANPLITGVVYTDGDSDAFYSVGEGIVGGTISAQPVGGGATVTADIASTGGYALEVTSGTYTVVASVTVNGVAKLYVSNVTVGTENEKVDFETNTAAELGLLSVNLSKASIWENDGSNAATATITRTGDLSNALEVSILSSDSNEATSGASTVTIAAQSSSATFAINAIDETTLDGTKDVIFSVSGAGIQSGSATIQVRDDERPYLPLTVQEGGSSTPTFSWTAVAGATHYALWVDSITTGTSQVIFESNITTNSYTPFTALELGSYRAWVQARNSTVSSVWSGAQIYHVRTRGNMTGPMDGSDTTPAFTWNAIPGADVSDLWVNNLSTNTSQALRVQNISGNSYTPTVPLPLGRYQAWIRSIAADQLTGYWSTGIVFRIDVPPTITGVSAASLTANPTATWNAIDGASKYEVFVRNLTTGANPHLNDKNVASSSLALTGLTAGRYRLWVRAADAKGSWYSWSSGFDFSFNAAPTPTSPSGGTPDTTPTITWTPTSGATRYDLWVSNLTTGQPQVIREQNLTDTSFTPAVPLAAAAYRVWIRAFDNSGNQTGWSVILDFTVTASDRPENDHSATDAYLFASLEPELEPLTDEESAPNQDDAAPSETASRHDSDTPAPAVVVSNNHVDSAVSPPTVPQTPPVDSTGQSLPDGPLAFVDRVFTQMAGAHFPSGF